MTDRKDGGPAFPARPTEHLASGHMITAHHGMSLRDAFALAMAPAIFKQVSENMKAAGTLLDDETNAFRVAAKCSYIAADEMLEARK